ncbi:hypothetical protein LDENG_00275220 [Lucifuga dentata]|nr:hypothetical protein LDENG_00275220 [Lucifuga dentata]
MSLRSSGTSCVVRGYTRNRAKLNQWLGQECFEHRPLSRRDCSCPKRYDFHRLPTEDEAKRMWLKNSNMKQPPKELYVCSFHSVEKTPTQEKPCPALWRGYERPPEKRRRILKRSDDVAPASGMFCY